MDLALFMQPLHHPSRTVTDMLDEDRAAVILADELGFSEVWVGEHYTSGIERIVNPLQFFASLIEATKQIKFATGVIPLPQHHPAHVAGDVAQFDHLCKGRFVLGIGPGALVSDWELFETWEKNRNEMTRESIDMILKIWRSEPPYRIVGKHWRAIVEKSVDAQLQFGPMVRPYQLPHPPIVCSALSPNSSTARFAGERGWGLVSSNFLQPVWVRTHWDQYLVGCERAGRKADRNDWRIARSILVTESDAEAAEYLAKADNAYERYFRFVIDNMTQAKILVALKPRVSMADNEVTVRHCLETLVYSGSPNTVLDRLVDFVDAVGGTFGSLLFTFKDWDVPALAQKGMQLLANEVMPKLRDYCNAQKSVAAE